MSYIVAFALGVFCGIALGPVAVYAIAFYFSSRDRRAQLSRPS